MSAERIVRSKGSASQPNKVVINGVSLRRCDFKDVFGKSDNHITLYRASSLMIVKYTAAEYEMFCCN